MRWLPALALLGICLGCSAPKKADPLAGTYEGWMFIDGKAVPSDGTAGVTHRVTLKSDGTYTYELNSTVMATVSVKAEGVYVHSGDTVNLDGMMTATMDDGYKKGTDKGPQHLRFKLENGMLMEKDGKGDPFYFRKVGTGPPPLPPQLQLRRSDQAAVALLKQVEKTYANLKTFSVTGNVKSQGGGFVAKDARFKVLFQSPSQFRFESSIFEAKTEIDHVEITWDGGATCWWYSKEFGETTERSLGNAMGIAEVDFGPEADVLPTLLLPRQVGGRLLSEYPEITLLPDETIGGKPCSVVQLKSKGADATKLWIEKSSHMILRLYEDLREVTVNFDPHPNVALDPKELMLGRRSKSEAISRVGENRPRVLQ